LSGGNQQKVVIAKWLISEQPKLIVMDHPMRGLDVGAKAEVFELIRNLSQNGIGIVLIADTLEELIALSNTIFVMRDGIITAKFEECWKTKPSKLEILERMI
jgi:ribose transport system ATP-binding protein